MRINFKTLISLVLAAITLFLISGCKDEPVTTPPEKLSFEAEIYFASGSGTELVPEKRVFELSDESELPRAVLGALSEGPLNKELKSTLHKDSVFEGISVKNGQASVEITPDFIPLNSGGTLKEFNAIYSVVDSLVKLEGIDSVIFTVEGETRREFGSFYFEEPLTFKTNLNE